MQILTTSRLSLKTMSEEDFTPLYEKVFSDIRVVKETFGSTLFSFEECQEFLKAHGNFSSKIGLSTLWYENSIIGLAGILPCSYLDDEDYEIGFILSFESWGKGFAQEIGRAQIELIQKIGKQRALAVVAPHNEGSMHALKRLGFEYVTSTMTQDRGERLVYVLEF